MKLNKRVLKILMIVTLSTILLAACGNKENDILTPAVTAEPTNQAEATPTVEPTPIPTETVATPTVTPITLVDPKATIDGTTYKSEGYGFSITMPEKWVVLEQGGTYDYLNATMGNAYESGEALKTAIEAQGLSYLFMATNSEIQKNGATDNFIVQTIPSELLGGLSLESMVGEFGTATKNQYKNMGATCDITEPVKTTKDGMDYFTFDIVANLPTGTNVNDTATVYQSMMYFEKDGTVMQLAGTAVSKENLKMINKIFDSIVIE
ncbi:MAG TPA: hypothetical protein DHW61_11305 [Lachnoclostridium phytofermentans]|uniref:PsbP C-terminal domain-containing protein n=1 Tax=Lachnoclostridium phytofermentans TaxID=66219 RepID=A0A3D2X7L6_9FIRM|nr:hypothetical protein [Lachnoclostridium sp.]HCL02976.1 hypothetical protein [Lachnoclostridium phytofermentans]